tara:strand:- start:592 stop:1107 length:516 start_codon:yes stop_codon:yes gene_type:complete
LDTYLINFASLKKGKQSLVIDIDDKFFAKFNFFDFENVNLKVVVEIEKQETFINFSLLIIGSVEVLCDLSIEKFKLPVQSNFNFTVKFGKVFESKNDELIILAIGAKDIDISQQIYETVILSIPERKVHPGVQNGTLKSETLDKLEVLKPNQKKFSKKTDPRWNKLKNLLK